MDYSESLLYINAYVKKAHEALLKRNFKLARDVAGEITAEAKQLEGIIDNMIEVLGE
jgi:phage shock protein A